VTRTNALEALVIAGFVRGLSSRDIEASLTEALGPQAVLSRSTVSRICAQLAEEFTAWATRRLDDVALDYLYSMGPFSITTPARVPSPSWSPAASPPGARGQRGP
jgi:transposase-like protein